VFGGAGTPDADGYVTLTATGLTANTRYYYRVEMTDTNSTVELDTAATVGRIKTAPSGAASFAFDFGSCANSTDPIVFPLITARADDMFFHLGDMFYNDGSGTTLANIRSKLEGKIQATNHAALYAQINMAHTPSDHDVAQNDSNNGTDPTAWGNYRTASAQLFPDVDHYYTWVWGRVRFIKLDTKNFASDSSLTDNSSKSLLGTTQKQWFKDTIDAATEPAMVIVQSDPWNGSAIAGDNGWFGFTTERTELANYMVASGKNFVIIGGDMHAAAADDGTNSPGGITLFQAAPFGQTASQKGGPYTTGPIPSSGTAFTTHYGRVVVTDTGGSIAFAFNAYDSTDTSVVNLTKTFTLTVPVALSGSGTLTKTVTPGASQTAALSGSGTLTSTQVPAVPAAGTFSGSGTLSKAVTVAFSAASGLSGSGTLTTSGITPGASPTANLSGSGLLEIDQDAVTVSSSVALSSTGTLTKSVVANFTASMTQTSTGTLAASVTGMSASQAATFSGSGTLTSTRTPAANTSGTLSGSGTLSSTQSLTATASASLSGEGTLSIQASNSFNRDASFSGSGTLSQTNTPALSQSAALSGSGTLSASVVVNRSVSANLSGSGALSSTLTSVGVLKTVPFTGSGTLSASTVVERLSFPQLSGSGTLTANASPGIEYIFVGSGSGSLTTDETPALNVQANFGGVGTLVADPADLLNYEVIGYLAEKRWNTLLGSQRWKGSL
jgi:alkaline phosphatase D